LRASVTPGLRRTGAVTMITASAIQREISLKREAMVTDHGADWDRMVSEWSSHLSGHAFWLMYSANYLFNSHGLKWAVDPVRLRNRIPEAPAVDASGDLQALSFVLLTHAHIDHCDTELWSQLAPSRCHWIVPEHMLDLFLGTEGMRRSRYSLALPGRELVLPGIRIMPFAAPHGEFNAVGDFCDMPETGYMVEVGGSTYLLPGDVRTYDPLFLTRFTGASVVFAHVFLGRSAALDPTPPLLHDAIAFFLACRPRAIVLSHLYELIRQPEDCWRLEHAKLMEHVFASADVDMAVMSPSWYERVRLWA